MSFHKQSVTSWALYHLKSSVQRVRLSVKGDCILREREIEKLSANK